MADYRGVNYLRRRLQIKSERVKMRYKYYEMKNRVKDFQISTPPELRNVQSVLGWCGKAVDNLADRIVFREFTNDNFDIGEIFLMNNPDTFFDSAVLSALISSCCFVYISVDKTGFPKLQVIDGANATGIIDDSLEPINKWKAAMSSLLEFTKGEGGDKPQLGQFCAAKHITSQRSAKMFADYCGDRSNAGRSRVCNRQSSSAGNNQASHENLRLIAKKSAEDV